MDEELFASFVLDQETEPDEFSEDELAITIRVVRALGQRSATERQSHKYRALREAMLPFCEDFRVRFCKGGNLAEQTQSLAQRTLAAAKYQREKALDRNIINSRKLRASRLESLRQLQAASEHGTSLPLIPDGVAEMPIIPSISTGEESQSNIASSLFHQRSCYICKNRYREIHFFYDQLCENCASLNYQKRIQSADLRGYVSLVTGGRVKIGFQIALKLLRCGSAVIVTTRFPHDAVLRFSRQEDFEVWKGRLSIFGVDLRNLPSLERLCMMLHQRLPHLDIIINNACQTVRRPPVYFKHLLSREMENVVSLPQSLRPLLEAHYESERISTDALTASFDVPVETINANTPSALLSQLPLTKEDYEVDEALFPVNTFDVNQQQLDLRSKNTWLLKLEEVSTPELMEASRYIINVSAMEGKFYRYKMPTHPHTNMAKAALNMMTRTSAADFAQSNIFMNAVDTGWINDENPLEKARDIAERSNFQTPIDEVDAMARVLDPVICGVRDSVNCYGLFLKDYVESEW